MDYQRLLPEMETVYVVSDRQIIQAPTATVGQVESEISTSVPHILNQHY
jgi:hypothetical protein